jgi:hypothetical protein
MRIVGCGQLALLLRDEAPHLVNLNAAAIEATHPLIQKALASVANLD